MAGTAQLTLRIPAGTLNPATGAPFTVGDTMPIWGFDEASGLWKRGKDAAGADMNGAIIANPDGSLGVQFDAPHFSWWNADWPVDTHNCITGQVKDNQGNPVANAQVLSEGISYQSRQYCYATDANGYFKFDCLRGSTVGVSATLGGRKTPIMTINVPNVQSTQSLPPSGTNVYTPISDLLLQDESCATGIVRDTTGRILAGALVEAVGQNVWSTADATGKYCLNGLTTSTTYTLRATTSVAGFRFSTQVAISTGGTPALTAHRRVSRAIVRDQPSRNMGRMNQSTTLCTGEQVSWWTTAAPPEDPALSGSSPEPGRSTWAA